LDERGRTVEKGEAYTFTENLIAGGAKPQAVGRIGHLIPMVAVTPGEGHEAPEWKFLWQLLC